MNQTGIVGDDYNDNLFDKHKNNKTIYSTFTLMIKLV